MINLIIFTDEYLFPIYPKSPVISLWLLETEVGENLITCISSAKHTIQIIGDLPNF